MKKMAILLWASFIPYLLFAQNKYSSNGTMVTVAVGSDGIVMAADSRLQFGKPLSMTDKAIYFTADNDTKIHFIGRYLITFTGSGGYKNRGLEQAIREFLATKPIYNEPEHLMIKLLYFIRDNDSFLYEQMRITATSMLCCGYYKGKPIVAAMRGHQVWRVKNGFYSSKPIDKNAEVYDPKLTCAKQKIFLEKLIKEWPKTESQKNEIGGPIMSAKINRENKKIWMCERKKFKDFNSFSERVCYYMNHRAEIGIIDKGGMEQMFSDYVDSCKARNPTNSHN